MARAVESQNPGFFRTLAATNAAENILVSTVHGGPIAKIDGTAWLHGAGAVLAIVGGNMAILVGTAIARAASLGLAVLGLLSFMTLVINSKSAGYAFCLTEHGSGAASIRSSWGRCSQPPTDSAAHIDHLWRTP